MSPEQEIIPTSKVAWEQKSNSGKTPKKPTFVEIGLDISAYLFCLLVYS